MKDGSNAHGWIVKEIVAPQKKCLLKRKATPHRGTEKLISEIQLFRGLCFLKRNLSVSVPRW
jgi:hypothetical protein